VTGKVTDLSEFTGLTSLEVSDTSITNTDLVFLDTLPNKEKLEKIGFSGNRIREVDFADLFTKFPNLEKINLQNNPLSVKQLDKLSNEQFSRLVNGIENRNIKIDPLGSSKATISKDLLEYAEKLIARDENKHLAYQLQEFVLGNQHKNSSDNKTPLLVSGLIVFSVFVLVIGC